MSDSNSPEINAETRPRIVIAEALRDRWFEIWYQPKIDLRRKCLAGAEALARIRHPELGVLLPGSFVPEVDEDGIAELAKFTLVTALQDWASFEAADFNLHLAVNVPVGVLLRLSIPQLVLANRPKSTRWPGIIVEVTEDQMVRDRALADKIGAQLQVNGISIAIDDFGAGYSFLSRLRDLPFAELKLARDFVSGCAGDATNAAICQTGIDLAHRFGSAAVVDGVDNAVDLQAVMVMGCDFAQGAVIAPSLAKQDFLALLQRHNAPRPAAPRDVIQAGAKPVSKVA